MDFKTSVLDKSFEKPVLVDFWAEWCGPCRILGPTIEKIAEEQTDKWELVKVNTEDHPELAERYGIRSIPNVKVFYKGEVIDEFMGALSRPTLLNWLEEHLPDGRKEALSDILQIPDAEERKQQLQQFVQQNPNLKEARLALAELLLYESPDQAISLLEPIKLGDKLEDQASNLRTLAELLDYQTDSDTPVAQLLVQAREALADQSQEAAIQHLINAASIDKSYADGLPRRAAIALFNTLGNAHPLTKAYRWKFDMVLY